MDSDAPRRDLITVGCANFAPVWGDKAATLDKMEATIREAAAQGIDLLLFPEKVLDYGPPDQDWRSLAETVPGPSTDRVAALAAELDIHVVFGLGERDAQDPDVLYNAAAYVAPDGVQGTYRKLFLGQPPWTPESEIYRPGDAVPVWDTPWGPIGILICFDFWLHPELSRIMALKGARLILNATASFAGPGKREFFVGTTVVRGTENICYTASANLVGGPGRADSYGAADLEGAREPVFGGNSTIAGPAFPRFNATFATAGATEELISATLSMTRLERWNAVYPWREWHTTVQHEAQAVVAQEFADLAT
jgi:predicted amidohydrolase